MLESVDYDGDRMLLICETLEENHGVSMDILSMNDLWWLVNRFGQERLCLRVMGDSVALVLNERVVYGGEEGES